MDSFNEQELKFSGSDKDCTLLINDNYSTKVYSSSPEEHTKGSSKLTLKNFVNFNWNQTYYQGQLIAIHISEKLIAYGFNAPETTDGLVRVVKRESGERCLIKGLGSLIEDISFAHIYEMKILACIDQLGNVNIYIIKEDSKKLDAILIFQIKGDPSCCYKNKHLLSWCQHIPEQVHFLKEQECNSTYKGKLLAIARGSEVEIWHIGIASSFTAGPIYSNFDLNQSISKDVLDSIKTVVIKINSIDSDIISLSFSPDGTCISIASKSGSIYFYQISFENKIVDENAKCVFFWHPKEVYMGLRSMVFLDNRKHINGDVELWKYIVTFSNHSEIILWSCETWSCLQKISFVRPYITENQMKLSVDGTGRFIFLSDIDNNILFVMEVCVDIKSPKKNIKIVSVTEILLHSPILNMIIVDAKINHNEINFMDDHNSDSTSDSLSKFTTIINLFAIQPKSLQVGQLTIPSPELSIKEQLMDNNVNKLKIFPKLYAPDTQIYANEIVPQNNNQSISLKQVHNISSVQDIAQNPDELSPMEVHNLVKEKLKLKGINLNKKNVTSDNKNTTNVQKSKKNNTQEAKVKAPNNCKTQQSTYKQPKTINMQKIDVQSSNDYSNSQNTYINEDRECSPSNNEVQNILKQHTDQQLKYEHFKLHNNFESTSQLKSIELKKEPNCYSDNSVLNGTNISTIEPLDKSNINNEIVNQIDDIHTCLQDINSQLNVILKKQTKTDNQIASSLLLNTSNLCQSLEPILMNMVKNANDQSHRKLQKSIDHQLTTSQMKISDTIINSNANKVDTELFTGKLVASLSPTLDSILKDLFMSTVIPKFEQACCSMFKQIDASFTERSLEYQNELKLLLNEEGNINFKLEYAFEKFKNDMSCIVKHTEKKILSAQKDMQKQFTFLLKEKSLSHVESYVKDSENIANQFMILSDMLEHGDVATAFERALSASNLELVLYVCEKVSPEELFNSQKNPLSTPIVLSLIQQLSIDLTINTDLKHKYLEIAVGSLDYTNEMHKDNIKLVLIKMDLNMDKFIQQYPTNNFSRKFKMLQLAVKSIINHNVS